MLINTLFEFRAALTDLSAVAMRDLKKDERKAILIALALGQHVGQCAVGIRGAEFGIFVA